MYFILQKSGPNTKGLYWMKEDFIATLIKTVWCVLAG